MDIHENLDPYFIAALALSLTSALVFGLVSLKLFITAIYAI
jgi:hypothetical protein